jgi:hypothetical protein
MSDPKNNEDHDECTIPERVSMKVLRATENKSPEHEKEEISRYVEWQARADEEKVQHLEKIKTESTLNGKMDAWDVYTDKSRYWVITNPTNLYSQELFPGLDYAISFHVGVTTRMMAKRKKTSAEDIGNKLMPAFRQWQQAAEAFDLADEAEEFQAVGARCREALTTLTRMLADAAMVPEGQEPPKGGDFKQWAPLIAKTIAAGDGAKEIRSFLKTLAESTWSLVSWLTHAKNAVRFDAQIAVEATETILAAFSAALMRYERGMPDRCPYCNSYKIASVFEPTLDMEHPYVNVCNNCDWNDFDEKLQNVNSYGEGG